MVENQHRLKKYDPIWEYFSGDGYSTRILKDFKLVDDKQHGLFVRLLCQSKDIWPAVSNIKMEIKHFDKHIYHLLEQDDMFDFLKKMAVPLQMKHWELDAPSENNIERITPKQLYHRYQQNEFQKDVFFRWKTYFSAISNTILDLENSSFLSLNSKNEIVFSEDLESKKKAEFLKQGLKETLDGVPEYLVQREACWYARETPLINLFGRLSAVFDCGEKNLTTEEFSDRELRMLDLLDRAVVWSVSNDIKGKVLAFDMVSQMRQDVYRRPLDEQKKEASDAIRIFLKRRMNGSENEKE